MSKNDDKIKEMLALIENKKKIVGHKPKASWRSNGVLKIDKNFININTISDVDVCVEAAAYYLKEKSSRTEAAKFLGVEVKEDTLIDDYLHDLKLKTSMIRWDTEKKKLSAMEDKLKDLRSEDAKTADALDEIMSNLNV